MNKQDGKEFGLYLIVMAGGSGTRFWPKSTSQRPKQLLSFGRSSSDATLSSDSLLVQTLRRFDGTVPVTNRIIVTTRSIASAIEEQAKGVRILSEPQGRNTAPCIYWAAREVFERDPKAIMLVMPSDHYIARPDDFRKTVAQAVELAASTDQLIALGIKPVRPETGYGYLKMGAPLGGGAAGRVVDAFVEKPDLEKAKQYLESGNYLWNGGMFIWRAEVILKAFDRYMPEMKTVWERYSGRVEDAYPHMTATSIDYGIMEKADNVCAFELDCGWDDLGSWTSLESLADVLRARAEGGIVTGGEVVAVESANNIIDAPGKTVALLDVNDMVIVEHGSVIMVAKKTRAQDIKLLVERIKRMRPELA